MKIGPFPVPESLWGKAGFAFLAVLAWAAAASAARSILLVTSPSLYNPSLASTWANIAAGLSMPVLAGLTAWYAHQTRQMADLQERQQHLMEATHEPLLQVLAVDSYSEFIWPKLRNIGNGPMMNIRAAIHFYYGPDDIEVDTEEAPLTHSADSEAVDVPPGEAAEIGSLSPGETGKLAAELRTPVLNGNDEMGPMGHLMNDFADSGIDEVVYQIEILYDHLMRTKGTGRHYLKLRKVEIQRQLSVDSVIQDGEEITDAELAENAGNFRKPGTYYDDL